MWQAFPLLDNDSHLLLRYFTCRASYLESELIDEGKMSMTSRERILAALRHQEPDRLPIDLGGTESSGIHGIAYNRLKKFLGLANGRAQIFDLSQMIVKVESAVLDAVGADAVPLLREPKQWKRWQLMDGSPCEIPQRADVRIADSGEWQLWDADICVARCPVGSYYLDTCYHPLAKASSPTDIEAGLAHLRRFDWPSYCDESFADMRRKAQALRAGSQRAIVGNLWVHVFAAGQILRGFENFMSDLLWNKKLVHALLGRLVDCYEERVREYVAAVGEYCDLILVNDDLGTQQGLQISPQLYREMIKPYHARLWGLIKRLSGKPLLLHSCGSIYELIPDLIELGVDALNPVQVSAAQMDTARLKKEFGRELTFWGGGCDTQRILPFGTPADVAQEVRRRCADLAAGGGFIFCQVHNIQPTVPPENIMAMYETVHQLSG